MLSRLFIVVLTMLCLTASSQAQGAKKLEADLVGKWKKEIAVGDKSITVVLSFRMDQSMTFQIGQATEKGSFKVIDGNTIEITVGKDLLKKTHRLTVSVDNKALTMKDSNGREDRFTSVAE